MTQKWTHRYELKPGRWVFVPTEDAKKFGSRVKQKVSECWSAPDFYFHLRPGGHLAAVRTHIDSRYFYRADLDDFFGRVNRSRVTRCLKAWFPYAEARVMASESVVKRPVLNGFVLPYGFVQSPILASLALDKSKLGALLRKIHKRSDLRVSVYVDDIIISGDDDVTLSEVAAQLDQAATAALFPISTTKVEGPSSGITAFNIEVSHQLLQITEARLSCLRELYQTATSENCKAGVLNYVESVNADQTKALF